MRAIEVNKESGCYEIVGEEIKQIKTSTDLGTIISTEQLLGWGKYIQAVEILDDNICPGVEVTRHYFISA